jgi:hypothetical protein
LYSILVGHGGSPNLDLSQSLCLLNERRRFAGDVFIERSSFSQDIDLRSLWC